MRRRTFSGYAAALLATVIAGPPAPGAAAPAQLRVDIEVYNLTLSQLPEAAQRPLRRLRRDTVVPGADAEKIGELLRRLDGQQVWDMGSFSRETEDGMPIIVRFGRRRQQMPSYGLTLTPSVRAGSIDVDAELRTGKPQTGACDPVVKNYSVKVAMGGYVAFWLHAQEAGKPDGVVVARFHPSE
jgi:hypothetical protein